MSKDLLNKLQQLDTTSNFMKHCPSEYFRTVFLAAVFILHLADSSFSSILDVEGGKIAFNTALLLMRRTSLEDNDMPGRISKILAQLWSLQGSSEQSKQEPHLKLKTRLSASLVHDQMWKWRERFGGQRIIQTPSINQTEIPVQETENQPDRKGLEENADISLPSNTVNLLSFEDVFNVEMMSLLPFELDDFSDIGTSFFSQDSI
ncbi:hypothetical protein N7495_006581 [Penicillium taxi]|uniref:uncharacterized protein n=1 Tax=Penicillium taxi TaxID=168475 RepID=UPI0025459620|nr:uncharacterized protein N7495_006581 [Penicillium taxi]KAJ5894890.1 hypothetical protein N7495_006581 [Penicillium taxi]